jgi:alginate O-acetyltransferase complex protein AlgI
VAFTSTVFIFAFLPVAILAFYVFPARWRAAPLLVLSAIFYAWGEPVLVLLILATGIFTYGWGRLLIRTRHRQQRGLLALGICICLLPIFCFKYLNFLLGQLRLLSPENQLQLPLPIGVSFYTFMAISYLLDIYRRRDDGAPNLLQFSGFLAMFPHLVAGPIVRWHHIGPQLAAPRWDPALFGYGALRVAAGLAKKTVIADQLAKLVDPLFTSGNSPTFAVAWLAAILYSLQIYFDFSAYSDIAIGLAAMLGVRFHENFNYPYLAINARTFWQRWHISLGSWFRDYVYIPLGGSRVKGWMLWRNLLAVWALTGIWHGAAWTFIVWGLYFGVLIGAERTLFGSWLAARSAVVQHSYGLLVILIGWVMFRANSVPQALEFYRAMFGFPVESAAPQSTGQFWLLLQQSWALIIVATLLAAGAARPIMQPLERLYAGTQDGQPLATSQSPVTISPARSLAVTGLTAALFLLGVTYAVASTYSPFIYFKF